MPTILTILEELVTAENGAAALAKVHALDPDRASRSKSDATAEHLRHFMSGVAAMRATPEGEAYRWVGEEVAPRVLRRLPNIQRQYASLRSLLLHVNELPTLGIQALVPDAEIPYFDVELMGADTLRFIFTGSVEARELLEGLILGCARTYGERIELYAPPPLPARPDRRVCDVKFEPESRTASSASAGSRGTPPRPR